MTGLTDPQIDPQIDPLIVRAPASSANLGAGFDVFGMALDLFADVGTGSAPDGARQLDEHHPARTAFDMLGGRGPIWMRCDIPMARGLGFSGAVRVAAAALGAANSAALAGERDPRAAIVARADEVLRVATELEGHGDNAAASLRGGVTAFVDGRAIPFRIGPVLGAAAVVAWVPDVTTSTDSSRRRLDDSVSRAGAVSNIAHATQFALAFAHDDPALLHGATTDALHEDDRMPLVPGAADAIDAGIAAGAWCGWLSGSGPTVAFLVSLERATGVAAALPAGGHTKVLSIDHDGARIIAP